MSAEKKKTERKSWNGRAARERDELYAESVAHSETSQGYDLFCILLLLTNGGERSKVWGDVVNFYHVFS